MNGIDLYMLTQGSQHKVREEGEGRRWGKQQGRKIKEGKKETSRKVEHKEEEAKRR